MPKLDLALVGMNLREQLEEMVRRVPLKSVSSSYEPLLLSILFAIHKLYLLPKAKFCHLTDSW